MIGDKVIPKPHHTEAAKEIFALIRPHACKQRITLNIAGESGAGKSEVAVELKRLFEAADLPAFVFAQDDYFHLPPKTNERTRMSNIQRVGIDEVNLRLLDEHLRRFKRNPGKRVTKPLVIYDEDRISKETIYPNAYKVAIAEGTYTTLLNESDFHVFIDCTHIDTHEHRKERSREADNEFYDAVLKIEHEIISQHKSLADIIVNRDYSVTPVKG